LASNAGVVGVVDEEEVGTPLTQATSACFVPGSTDASSVFSI